MRYFFIVNPIAGGISNVGRFEQAICRICRAKGASFEIARTEARGHAAQLAQRAVMMGYETIVAVGGDGTINEVGTALAGTSARLGVIPKGSGNGIADELGLAKDPELACRMLFECQPLRIDIGQAREDNGIVRRFINLAGLGFDAKVGRLFNQDGRRGKWPYFYLTLKEIFTYEPQPLILKIDGQESRLTPLLVAVANGRQYGCGAVIAPQARFNDGLFHLTLIESLPLIRTLACLPRLFDGRLAEIPGVQIITAKHVRVQPLGPLYYHLDGESFETKFPLDIQLIPSALTLLVPAAAIPSQDRF